MPSRDTVSFNVGITGSGASALSLVYHLKNIPSVDSITIVAPNLQPCDDKTWCFWDNDAVLDKSLLHHSWGTLCVYAPDGSRIIEKMKEHSYMCVRSSRYQDVLFRKFKKDPKITFIEDAVRLVDVPDNLDESGKMGARIIGEKGAYFSDVVFQSHLRPDDSRMYNTDRIALKQHFLGWDIKCEQDIFDPEVAILMDFRVAQKDGFAFVYVLPFDKRNALVELTYFTTELLPRDEYKARLLEYLMDIWSCRLSDDSRAEKFRVDGKKKTHQSAPKSYFVIEREEFGVIPMVDGVIKQHDDYPVYSIGMAGGHAKASTGYTFSRIHKDSRRIADALKISSLPDRSSLSLTRYRFYDLLILNIIKNTPDQAVGIFTELFKKNGFDSMLSFLDEKTRFADDLKIMSSVPSYRVFFKSIWQTRHRWNDVWEGI
jgi:lycopene beta-cyclase